jgi:type I restriction enzyme R subunit
MPNFISEDDIEVAIVQKLQHLYGYDSLNCHTADPTDMNDGSGRRDKREVILRGPLKAAAIALNPRIPESAIDKALNDLCDRRQALSLINANRELDGLIRDGVRVEFKDAQGRHRTERVKVMDFEDPTSPHNHFLVVTQLWIQSTGVAAKAGYRRPDILLYINGLPLVFIELKNSNGKLRNAYDDNLTNYKADIPQLFLTNALCVLSNGIETRVGSLTASWEHYFHWLRPEDEKEKIRREQIREQGTSVERFLAGICPKSSLLDYVESFVLFHKQTQKIIAQNHQFLGVNRAFGVFCKRRESRDALGCNGSSQGTTLETPQAALEDIANKPRTPWRGAGGEGNTPQANGLGVFWHTQGSGKSFSMIFYARKIFRKLKGNYSFVIVTDREDLDRQIYQNFLNTETVKEAEASQPKNSEQMRKFLGENKRLVFTLIHKFRWQKGQAYPLLSERDDIIVIVDEAHRTQYKSLAENMRAGLPNAQYLAFTGTPLLGRERRTNAWFGDYVSEYNFSQSMDDGATVPLYYTKRVPEMHIQNEDLSDEFYEILEDENLDEIQQEKLEKKFATEIEVIKRDDRLDAIAADIVYHFPRRGYLGKGMVITLDKFTAVKMHEKVSRLWNEEIKALHAKIRKTSSESEKRRLKQRVDYMRKVEMAVVISAENGEEEKFQKKGLDITTHRKRMNEVDEHGHDLEYNFKDPEHPLQLVFVCAMWLTGFDAPTVSTLYLDKPQKDHTLMQTIARANRVCSHAINGVEKKSGEVIDYYGVFRRLQKAIKDYGEGTDGSDDPPVKDKEKLFRLLDEAIEQGLVFCAPKGIHIQKALESEDVFEKVGMFSEWADKLLYKDEWRKHFAVLENTISSLFEACKPEIIGEPVVRTVAVFQYLRGVIDSVIERQDIDSALNKISDLLDESLVVAGDSVNESATVFKIEQKGKSWDLSKVDFDKLREEFKKATYKNIEIADLRAFIEQKLAGMLEKNRTRRDFAERLQGIIDQYNAGSSSVDADFEALMKFAESLREEEERHIRKGLTEDELEIYDLLCKEKMSQNEEQTVRLAAKQLLKRLTEESPKLLVQDWFKNSQTRLQVREQLAAVLDKYLPSESYDKALFNEKCEKLFELTLDLAINHRKWAA